MKRSQPLRQRTPLKRKTPLKVRNRSRIPAAVRAQVRGRSGGVCEARCAPACTGRAVHMHHIRARAQGGKHTVGNLLHLDWECHFWVHSHPEQSYENGWLRRAEA